MVSGRLCSLFKKSEDGKMPSSHCGSGFIGLIVTKSTLGGTLRAVSNPQAASFTRPEGFSVFAGGHVGGAAEGAAEILDIEESAAFGDLGDFEFRAGE